MTEHQQIDLWNVHAQINIMAFTNIIWYMVAGRFTPKQVYTLRDHLKNVQVYTK